MKHATGNRKAIFSFYTWMYPDIWQRKAKHFAGQNNIVGFLY